MWSIDFRETPSRRVEMVSSARLIFRKDDVMAGQTQHSKQVCLIAANGVDIQGADAD